MGQGKSAIEMTERWVASLKSSAQQQPCSSDERVDYFDAKVRGLVLRLSGSGHKAWAVLHRPVGEKRLKRQTIGTYPSLRLAEARSKALMVIAGLPNPAPQILAIEDDREAITFRQLADEYLQRYARVRKRSWHEDEQVIKRDLLPRWGDWDARAVRRRDVINLLDAIQERGAPIQANRTLALVRKMFNWAISRDLVDINPCSQVKAVAPERQRDRVLSEAELQAVWRKLSTLTPIAARAVKMRLLTAQRGGEVDQMRWDELDLGAAWWTIPSVKAKNKLSHRVPLSGAVLDLLADMRASHDDPDWVFPSSKRPGRPITNVRDAVDDVRVKAGVDFLPHDLRRTAASHLASLGVPRLVIGKILNHVEQGVTRVYDRHSYDREKRWALGMWADAAGAMVEGSRVNLEPMYPPMTYIGYGSSKAAGP